MGTEGFLHYEIYNEWVEEWFNPIDFTLWFTKNYSMFYAIAGIRKKDQQFLPLFPDRGIPSDCCKEISNKYDPLIFYDPTWFTVNELRQKWRPEFDHEFSDEFLFLLKAIENLNQSDHVQKHRLICWFYA